MSADAVEHFDACDLPSRGVFAQLFERARLMAARFPAVLHGLLSLTDQAIVSATSFATMIIIGRTTSPEQLGLYYLVASIVIITVGIEEQIVATPYTIYSKRFQGRELSKYSGSSWAHHFAFTVIGLLALLVVIGGLSLYGASSITPGLWALVGAGPFLLLREWVRRFSYANLQIASAVALDAIVAVAQLGGLLLLWRLDALTIFNIFAVMGAACALAVALWYLLERPVVEFDASRYRTDWKHNWSFARWTLRSFIVGNTTPYLMPWILGLAIGAAAAGVLGACVTLINVANLFIISVDRILTPRAAHAFAHGGRTELRKLLWQAAAVLLPALGAFCCMIFMFGSWAAVFAYGDKFAGLGSTLSALAAVMFMNGVSTVTGNGLWAIDQPRANFMADVATLVVTVASAAALVIPLGVLGGALAMLAGATVGSIVRTLTLRTAFNSLPVSSSMVEAN